MTDIAVDNARRRVAIAKSRILEIDNKIKELSDERSTLQSECDRANAFIEAWAEFAGVEVGTVAVADSTTPDTPQPSLKDESPSPKMKRTKNPKKEYVAAKARELILAHGKPMGRSELFNALSDAGVVIRGANPEMVLSTMLWRMNDEIVRLQPHGYWPAEVANEDAGYDPATYTKDTDVPDTSEDTSLDDLLS